VAGETNMSRTEFTSPSRRAVVTKAAQVAVTAPAVALLLNATSMSAFAQLCPYSGHPVNCGDPFFDDFTFGNTEEDIDAHNLGSNFNPNNGNANQDDRI
jgi:hypothetical protein